MRKGFTLVECMLAASIFCLMTLVLFEGVILSTRIAHENADLLAAEAVAWDAVWKRFNEDFGQLAIGTVVETLTEEQAPQLVKYDDPPVLTVTVGITDEVGFSLLPSDMLKISADVEWGPSGSRRRLSELSGDAGGHYVKTYRSRLGRVN